MEASLSAEAVKSTTLRKRTDRHLWGTYILLVILASLELFSASIQEVDNNIFEPIIRHGVFLLGGLLLMLFLQHIHYRHIYAFIPAYVLLCIGAMIAVQFSGKSGVINETQRALVVFGVQVMPADALKLAVALGVARILTRFRVKRKTKAGKSTTDVSWWGLAFCILFMGVCAGLLFKDGLSNTIIVCCIGFSMMLVGGMSWKKFAIAILIVGACGGGAYYYKTHQPPNPADQARNERIAELNQVAVGESLGHDRGKVWNNRIANHFRPNKHLESFSVEHQQEQLSYIAQAHGGFTGVGVGRSRENARLPLAHSDYIFAIIIEECGVFVGILIIGAYLWILGRSAKLTLRFKKVLPSMLVMGAAFTIVFQAIYHIAIVTGVFPVSGQPLPLFSRGGVSVLTTSIAFGIMLSAARHAVRITDPVAEAKMEKDLLPDAAIADNPSIVTSDSSK